jgi:hypothetical protein
MIVTGILLVISFFSYSCMGTLQFHFYQSIFFRFKNQKFWNPLLSVNNKYKNGNKLDGEAFWGSTHLFVFLTDGYHLMQFIFENSLFLAIAFYNSDYKWYLSFIGIRIIYGIVFNLFFDKILVLKKKPLK